MTRARTVLPVLTMCLLVPLAAAALPPAATAARVGAGQFVSHGYGDCWDAAGAVAARYEGSPTGAHWGLTLHTAGAFDAGPGTCGASAFRMDFFVPFEEDVSATGGTVALDRPCGGLTWTVSPFPRGGQLHAEFVQVLCNGALLQAAFDVVMG